MTDHTEYKTRPDGGIDYAHYVAHGRTLRSLALLRALRNLRASFRRVRRSERQANAAGLPEAGRTEPAERIEALAAE